MNLKDCLNQDLTRYESIPFWSWNDELSRTNCAGRSVR